MIEINKQSGYTYTGGDPYNVSNYIYEGHLVGSNPFTFNQFLYTDNDDIIRIPVALAVQYFLFDQMRPPADIHLPEIYFEDIKSGHWPWWWGNSDLFINGGIAVDDLWKLYHYEDPSTYIPFDREEDYSTTPYPHPLTNFLDAVTYFGFYQAIITFAPKLNSDFEKDLFHKYWNGTMYGLDYHLTSTEFNELKSIAVSQITDYLSGENLKDNNGNDFYYKGFNSYGSDKYDFAIGSGTAIFDASGNLVGIYDYYNFDSANRQWYAEFATRGAAFISPEDAENFYIRGGTYPDEIFNELKNKIK